ncbi:MAG: DUF3288 family protein [Cyanobacteria bacterium J06638_22]
MAESTQKDQTHPLWKRDREIVDRLLAETPTDYNLSELARLRVRYQGFPGARDIQGDLDKVLQKWNLTESGLFEQTRQIHEQGDVYGNKNAQQEDWS